MTTTTDLYRTAAGSVAALGFATALVAMRPEGPAGTALWSAATVVLVAAVGLGARALVLRGRDRPRQPMTTWSRLSLRHTDAAVHGDFHELLRDALDELPDILRAALERLPVIVCLGRPGDPYAVYRKGTVVISRDALLRDFPGAPDALREQVLQSVREALAYGLDARELVA